MIPPPGLTSWNVRPCNWLFITLGLTLCNAFDAKSCLPTAYTMLKCTIMTWLTVYPLYGLHTRDYISQYHSTHLTLSVLRPFHLIHLHPTTQLNSSLFTSSFLFLPSDWIPLSLDDKTAQKLLWISESNLKVSRMSEEVCPYPMRPERYEHSPQVGLPSSVSGHTS